MRRQIQMAAWLVLAGNYAWPQACVITTVAGTDFTFPNSPLPALNAPLGNPISVAIDSKGDLYIADPENFMVLKIDAGGMLSIVAGNGTNTYSGDGGSATHAALSPGCVALDSLGNLYICDSFNLRVRKVTPDGIITTIAGNGLDDSFGDGGPAIKRCDRLSRRLGRGCSGQCAGLCQ